MEEISKTHALFKNNWGIIMKYSSFILVEIKDNYCKIDVMGEDI